MADIELVIKITEESYKEIKKIVADRNDHYFLENIIANGTPLPKGHGRLVDEKDLSLATVHMIDGMFVCDAQTIIEADKVESEPQERNECMTYKENMTAILECYFAGFKKGIIDSACNRILEQIDNLISKEEKLNAFADYVGSGMGMDDFEALWNIVARMPSATSAEKVGRWIYGEDNLGGTGRDGWYCNQCGHFEFWDYSMDMMSAKHNLPNLCPNCGKKMEVEE